MNSKKNYIQYEAATPLWSSMQTTSFSPSGLNGDSEIEEIHTWLGRQHTQLQSADVESQWVRPAEDVSGQEQPAADTIH